MKRWLSCLLIIAALSNFRMSLCAADVDYAEAVFSGEYASCINMSAALTNDITPGLSEKDGMTGWLLDPETTNGSYIRCNINDSFISKLSYGETVYVDVTYFDENYGGFAIYYDGVERRASNFVQLENSLEWKTHRFTLNDAYFGNGLKTNDFEIITNLEDEMGKSVSGVVIGRIRVEKANTVAPFKIWTESDRYGNIFFDDEHISVNICYQNMTSQNYNTVDIKYDILNQNDEIVYTFDSSLNIDSSAEDMINIRTVPYGVYEIAVTVTGGNIYQTEVFDFARSRRADEMNFRFGTNFHYDDGEYSLTDIKELTDLMKSAGYGFVRSSLRWHEIEKVKGEYKIPENVKYANEYVDEIGMEMLAIVYSENPLYDSYPYYLESDDARKAFENYCYFVADDLKGVTDYFCMLNEFNMAGGNGDYVNNEVQYFDIAKAGYAGLTNANPNVFINGGSLAGPGREYRTKAFMKGLLDYCDSFSIHLYATGSESEVEWLTKSAQTLKNDLKIWGKKTQTWVTESGWPTRNFEDANQIEFVNYEQQAKYLARQLIIENDQTRTDKWFNYCFQDYSGKNYFNRNYHYGILHSTDHRTPNAAKPSYLAVCAFNDIVGNAVAYGNVNNSENGYVHKFVNSKNEEIFCIWKSSEMAGGVYNFITDKPYIEICDMYGNTTTVNSMPGGYEIEFSEFPVYVKGVDKIPDVVQNGKAIECLWYAADDNFSVKFIPYESEQKEISVICAMYKKDVLSHTLVNREKNTGSEIISEFKVDNSYEYDSVRFFVFDGIHSIIPLTPEKRVNYYGDSKNVSIDKSESGFIISGALPDKKAEENVMLTIYKNGVRKDELENNISASDVIYINEAVTDENGRFSFSVENMPESFVVIVSNKYFSEQKLYK